MIHVISKVQLLILRNQYDRGHLDSWDLEGNAHYFRCSSKKKVSGIYTNVHLHPPFLELEVCGVWGGEWGGGKGGKRYNMM